MGAAGWLIRHHLRRRWAAVVPLVLIVALGGGGALGALGAAHRTATAYDRYLAEAEVGDLVINPSLATSEIDAAVRDLPGVRSLTSDVLLYTTVDDDGPRTRDEVEGGPAILVRGSTDGRYEEMDRPALSAGRGLRGPNEAIASTDLARAEDVHVGDVLPISFWSSRDDVLAGATDVISPVGVEQVTVVGIGTVAGEVLPDDLYPRGQLLVSADVVRRHACLPDAPAPTASFEEAVTALLPADCSTSYDFYSLDLEHGAAGVDAVVADFMAAAARLSEALPADLVSQGVGYELVSAITTAQEQARVERSAQPTVAALGVLAGGAGLVTVVAAWLFVARLVRRAEDEQRQRWQLGMTAGERAWVVLLPLVLAVASGALIALGLAWALSTLGPAGLVRAVDPSPVREVSSWVLGGAAALVGVGAAVTTLLALRGARRAARGAVVAAQHRSRLAGSSGRPDLDDGLRAAFSGNRGSGVLVASGALAGGALLAAIVFGSSLSTVVSTPADYGWPWDAAVMGGYGYGRQDLDEVRASLDARDDVEGWTGLGFTSLQVEGTPVVALITMGDPRPELTVVRGRLPEGDHEVALGSRTASALEVGVGDAVHIQGDAVEARDAVVTAIVALPAVGPYQSDRAGPGTGVVVPAATFDEEVVAGLVGFIAIDAASSTDGATLIDDLQDDTIRWSAEGDLPFSYSEPVRPAEIANAASMRSVPLVVGGLLTAAAAAGFWLALTASVRARRRSLGILRALGFTGRQLRTSVRAQALAVTTAALLIGVPLGIVAGRLAWRSFAAQLGVVTDPSVPLLALAAVVAGWLLVALVAGEHPGRAAAKVPSAEALRSE